MARRRKIRPTLILLGILLGLLGALMPVRLAAQNDSSPAPNDPNDASLGDVARSLRKKTPSSQAVIDDDNLTTVMQQAESRRAPGSALKFLMTGEGKGFQISAPDVTCSLAFSANVKSLLSSQYAQMELPASEMLKLEGPATIEGDTLIVSVYNRTDWHVSELAVALTIVKKNGAREESMALGGIGSGTVNSMPAAAAYPSQENEVRPEKKPDAIAIYRMRAAAPPSTTSVFSARLGRDFAPDEEWHWAIVQARGYPPQSYARNASPATAQSTGPGLAESSSERSEPVSTLSPEAAQPQNSPAASVPQNPQ
jgi:hypothetical protein